MAKVVYGRYERESSGRTCILFTCTNVRWCMTRAASFEMLLLEIIDR